MFPLLNDVGSTDYRVNPRFHLESRRIIGYWERKFRWSLLRRKSIEFGFESKEDGNDLQSYSIVQY